MCRVNLRLNKYHMTTWNKTSKYILQYVLLWYIVYGPCIIDEMASLVPKWLSVEFWASWPERGIQTSSTCYLLLFSSLEYYYILLDCRFFIFTHLPPPRPSLYLLHAHSSPRLLPAMAQIRGTAGYNLGHQNPFGGPGSADATSDPSPLDAIREHTSKIEDWLDTMSDPIKPYVVFFGATKQRAAPKQGMHATNTVFIRAGTCRPSDGFSSWSPSSRTRYAF